MEALAITPAFELATPQHGELHCNLLEVARGPDLNPASACQQEHAARPEHDHAAKEYQQGIHANYKKDKKEKQEVKPQ
jgi:hypothetical protein